MGLTEREKRLLAEMEAALASDDPRLQSTLSSETSARTARLKSPSLLKGLALFITGLSGLFYGVIAPLYIVGIAGFILALVGLILTIDRIGSPVSIAAAGKPRAAKPPRSSFNERLQNRWDQRNFE
jgi:hypothetical protein